MNADGREILFGQQLGQCHTTLHRFHENDHLIELQHVQQFEQFFVLLVLLQLNVMLLQTVQCQFGFIIDIHLHGLKANQKKFNAKKGRKEKENVCQFLKSC